MPVDSVSWEQAVKFCNWLSQREGLAEVYAYDSTAQEWIYNRSANGYRLPTEAEWEFAAREGGKPGTWPFGEDESLLKDYGVYGQDWDAGASTVKSKKPNALGIYDLHGNLWEWCWDGYAERYDDNDIVNPQGSDRGKFRVLRGGSYWVVVLDLRSAYRVIGYPGDWVGSGGFRVVRSPRQQ